MYKGWKFENPKKLKNCIRVCVCGLGRKVFFQGNILMWNCTLGLGFLGLFLGSFGTAAAAVAAAALVVVGTCAGIVWAECEHGQGGGTAAAAACTTAFCSELALLNGRPRSIVGGGGEDAHAHEADEEEDGEVLQGDLLFNSKEV